MRAKRLNREAKALNLNISSLMDILTILLLFLILSYGSQEENVLPPAEIELPDSTSESQVKVALSVSIAETEILVEEKSILKLGPGQQLRRGQLDKNKRIKALGKELRRKKAEISEQKTMSEGEEEEREIIYLHAAKGTRYDLLDLVLKTAAEAGFTKFRLAVHRKS